MKSEKIKIFKAVIFIQIFLTCLFFVSPVLAHVVVRPDKVAIGKFQTFTIGVPNEKDIPTVGVRLLIPEGLQHVTPNVKSGWNIEVKKEKVYEGMKGETLNTGEEAPYTEKVTEIIWTGGSIPAGQRDEFLFSAQVPAETTTLIWKAYQTYEDGTEVAWDTEAEEVTSHDDDAEDEHKKETGPYSRTEVINDLQDGNMSSAVNTTKSNMPLYVSFFALGLSGISLWMNLTNKKKK